MKLSISKPPTGEVELPSGVTVSFRGLTRAEAVQLGPMGQDVRAIEIHCIRAGCGISEEEAEAYWEESRQDDVEQLVNAIARVSGLDDKTGKAAAGDSPSAKPTQSTT